MTLINAISNEKCTSEEHPKRSKKVTNTLPVKKKGREQMHSGVSGGYSNEFNVLRSFLKYYHFL
jgi:hypothetical protein